MSQFNHKKILSFLFDFRSDVLTKEEAIGLSPLFAVIYIVTIHSNLTELARTHPKLSTLTGHRLTTQPSPVDLPPQGTHLTLELTVVPKLLVSCHRVSVVGHKTVLPLFSSIVHMTLNKH